MGKSFPVGRARRRAPPHRAVHRKDACSVSAAGGRQRSICAPKWPEISTFPSPVIKRKMFMASLLLAVVGVSAMMLLILCLM